MRNVAFHDTACVMPHHITAAASFTNWVGTAAAGDSIEYHRGFLAVDRSNASELDRKSRAACDELGDCAFRAAAAGQVDLLQRRVGPGSFSYIAVLRRQEARS
jgi:hypothetical protein